jgi:hypothetical protein
MDTVDLIGHRRYFVNELKNLLTVPLGPPGRWALDPRAPICRPAATIQRIARSRRRQGDDPRIRVGR